MRLIQRCTVWCPTLLGAGCIFLLLAIPAVWWFGCGESFLSLTQRLPAEVLVFAKVAGPRIKVGVISWVPSDDRAVRWWKSSKRAKELLTETAGYLYEALLNSGLMSNAPREDTSPGLSQHLIDRFAIVADPAISLTMQETQM
jgi:hypothetical protein